MVKKLGHLNNQCTSKFDYEQRTQIRSNWLQFESQLNRIIIQGTLQSAQQQQNLQRGLEQSLTPR